MSRTLRLLCLPLMLATLTATAACDGDPAGLDPQQAAMAQVAGHYVIGEEYGATELTTTDQGETTDWLVLGAEVEMNLTVDGTTTGRLFVPGADEDGGDFVADLSGRWTLRGDTVRFDHTADTFIRDTPFLVQGMRLVGEERFGGAAVRLIFAKR